MSAEGHLPPQLPGLEEIEETECWRLLASRPVGRFGVILGDYPLIFPVNHAVVAHGVVFWTAPDAKLWATRHHNVSFEVDDLDLAEQTGWSVLVRGRAREVTAAVNPDLVRTLEAAAPRSWAPGSKEYLMRMFADSISGRRIRSSGSI